MASKWTSTLNPPPSDYKAEIVLVIDEAGAVSIKEADRATTGSSWTKDHDRFILCPAIGVSTAACIPPP